MNALRLRLWTLVLVVLVALPSQAEIVWRVGVSGKFSRQRVNDLQGALRGSPLRLRLDEEWNGSGDLGLLQAVRAGDCQAALVRSCVLANFQRHWGLISLPYQCPQGPSPQLLARLLGSTRGRGLLAQEAVDLGPRVLALRRGLEPALGGRLAGRLAVPPCRFLARWGQAWHGETSVMARERDLDWLKGQSEIAAVDVAWMDWSDFSWRSSFAMTVDPGHAREMLVLVVHEPSWERLSPEQQRLWLEALRRSRAPAQQRLRERLAERHCQPLPDTARAQLLERSLELRQRCLRVLGAPWSQL